MTLPLNPPPKTGNVALDKWLNLVWIKLGQATDVAPISVSGAAATSAALQIVPTAGSPEGVIAAAPGTFARDPSTGTLYLKDAGTGDTGWELA